MSAPVFRSIAFRITPAVISDLDNRLFGVEGTIATKADASALTSGLASKADQVALDAVDGRLMAAEGAIATKADAAALASGLAEKANTVVVDGIDGRLVLAEGALAGKADASAVAALDGTVQALNQAADVLVGPSGALQVSQIPGSSNIFVYNGGVQTLA